MMKLSSARLSNALTAGLVAGAILAIMLVCERIVAALFDAWKFSESGRWAGIDLGAQSSLQFLCLCLLGTSGCLGVLSKFPEAGPKNLKLILFAGGLYVCAGVALVLMVSMGAAYLYCGR